MKELTGSPTASHIKSSSPSLQVQCLRWQSMFEDHDDGYDNIDDHEMNDLNDCNFYQQVQCLLWQSEY